MNVQQAVRAAVILLVAMSLNACSETSSGVLASGQTKVLRPPAPDSATRLDGDELPRPGSPLRFGMAPFVGTGPTGTRFEPVTRFLEAALGAPVELIVGESYEHLIGMAARDEVDFALMPPLAFVIASGANARLRLLATATNECRTYYSSLFLVRRDSELQELAELRGRPVAFVSETSTSGYLFPVAALQKAGLTDADGVKMRWAGSHTAAIELLGRGEVDAAATATGMLEIAYEDSGGVEALHPSRFRVLHKAGDLPYDALCTTATLDDDAAAKVFAAFALLHPANPSATEALAAYQFTGFVPATDRDYDGVRRVHRAVRETAASGSNANLTPPVPSP